MTSDQWVVRVRARGRVYTTAAVAKATAAQRRDEIRLAIHNTGDGAGMLVMVDRNGFEIDIRTRDIGAVELAHDGSEDPEGDRLRARARPGERPRPRAVIVRDVHAEVQGGGATRPEDGLTYLRDVAGSMVRHPSGRSR